MLQGEGNPGDCEKKADHWKLYHLTCTRPLLLLASAILKMSRHRKKLTLVIAEKLQRCKILQVRLQSFYSIMFMLISVSEERGEGLRKIKTIKVIRSFCKHQEEPYSQEYILFGELCCSETNAIKCNN